ncbi:hypothetical protein NUW58_g6322 [Xylaria curta]|uniref:Uncharacterized protein n=1 Tax=Xylaria curta TaxID=42375 RepID=A0ACC1NVU8_9PEZI|nr:hypothetical protein NUW58_g6322 [Xylaria curta]
MEAIRNLAPEGLPVSLQVVGATVLLGIIYSLFVKDKLWSGFPIITARGLGPRKSWMLHAGEVLKEGSKTNGSFQILTGTGPKIILPNRYADEIRNLPELNFPKAFIGDFFTSYPGFEPHKQSLTQDFLLRDTVRIKLTQSLGLVTGDLVDETIATVDDVFGKSGEWTTRLIREDLLEIVARVSSRVFLGAELCRNRRWLEIAKTFTVDTFALSIMMRMVPAFVRPFVYLVLPPLGEGSWHLVFSLRFRK